MTETQEIAQPKTHENGSLPSPSAMIKQTTIKNTVTISGVGFRR